MSSGRGCNQVLEALRRSDSHGLGHIKIAELKAAIQLLDGNLWTDERADKVLRAADKHGKGVLHYEDFIRWLGSADDSGAAQEQLPPQFSAHEGFISKGGDLLVATMTISEAKRKCQELPNCKGFTFKGAPTDQAVEIRFKNKWDLQGNGWTSYLRQDEVSEATREVWLRSIKTAGAAFSASKLRLMPVEARSDNLVVLEAVRQQASAFQHAALSLRCDRDFVKQAVLCQPDCLRWASEDVRDDAEVVLVAVQSDARALQYASQAPRADKAVVLQAVAKSGTTLAFASDSLKEDLEVATTAFKQLHVPGLAQCSCIRDVYLAAVRKLGIWLELAPESLKQDTSVIFEALRQLKVADIRENMSVPELYRAALKKYGRCLLFAPESLKADKEFVLSVLVDQGWLLEFASESLRSDKEVVLVAFKQLKVPGLRDNMTVEELFESAGKASAEYANWSPLRKGFTASV